MAQDKYSHSFFFKYINTISRKTMCALKKHKLAVLIDEKK